MKRLCEQIKALAERPRAIARRLAQTGAKSPTPITDHAQPKLGHDVQGSAALQSEELLQLVQESCIRVTAEKRAAKLRLACANVIEDHGIWP
jgi:hypothetical protein